MGSLSLSLRLGVVLCMPFACGCAFESEEPPSIADTDTVVVIGPSGGVAEAHGIQIDFPPGAVSHPTEFTLTKIEPPVGPGPAFEVGPSGFEFARSPEMTIELSELACDTGIDFVLGTTEAGEWTPIDGSERSGCEVRGPIAHLSPFAPIMGLPLSDLAQNYLLEAILGARYHHSPLGQFRDFLSRGFQTLGVRRFLSVPKFCIQTSSSDNRNAAVKALGGTANDTGIVAELLSDPNANPVIEFGSACLTPDPSNPCPLPSELPDDQVTIFFDCSAYLGPKGVPIFGNGPNGAHIRGGEVTGGAAYTVMLASNDEFSESQKRLLRHEVGHAFGLEHTWGVPDVMSQRHDKGQTTDYQPHELEAFAVWNQLPVGIGIRDLLSLDVIDTAPTVFDQAPVLDQARFWDTQPVVPKFEPATTAGVGESVYFTGSRLSMAFNTESRIGERRISYAPSILTFGNVDIVSSFDLDFQRGADEGVRPEEVLGYPTASTRIIIPTGASGTLTLETRGQTATLPSTVFSVTGATVPNLADTPKPVENLTCVRGSDNTTELTWTLPSQYEDGKPLNKNEFSVHVRRNGELLPALAGDTTMMTDIVRPAWEEQLYQVFAVDDQTGEVSKPSTVCRVNERLEEKEVSLILIDATGSMNSRFFSGPLGISRYERVVGPLPAGQTPRAFLAVEELFGPVGNPRTPAPSVAVCTFNSDSGVFDLIRAVQVPNFVNDFECKAFSSDRQIVEQALLLAQQNGALSLTPLVDAVCVSLPELEATFNASAPAYATARIFTDGGENFSVGVPQCPSSCQQAINWNSSCAPGTCPAVAGETPSLGVVPFASENCSACQQDLFEQYCATSLNFFVEYFGPGGPFSPLPDDANYLFALANETDGRFTWVTDTGNVTQGIPGEFPSTIVMSDGPFVGECDGPDGGPVDLFATAHSDDPPEAVSFRWAGPFVGVPAGFVDGSPVTVRLPIGSSTVSVVVSDEHQRSSPHLVDVGVVDTTPPTLGSVMIDDTCLWPPNHHFAAFSLSESVEVEANDLCDDSELRLLVTNIEIEDEPTGKRQPAADDDVVVSDEGFCLRATRSGSGTGRTYLVSFAVEDRFGNRSEETTVSVDVPHDQSDKSCPAESRGDGTCPFGD